MNVRGRTDPTGPTLHLLTTIYPRQAAMSPTEILIKCIVLLLMAAGLAWMIYQQANMDE